MKRKMKEKTAYGAAAGGIMDRFNAVYTADASYPYTVATKAGDLLVSIGDDCCICTRFVDIKAAIELDLGDRLNDKSGKWNWMGGDTHQGDMLDLAAFQHALRKIV